MHIVHTLQIRLVGPIASGSRQMHIYVKCDGCVPGYSNLFCVGVPYRLLIHVVARPLLHNRVLSWSWKLPCEFVRPILWVLLHGLFGHALL
jgi:hypothetical protein